MLSVGAEKGAAMSSADAVSHALCFASTDYHDLLRVYLTMHVQPNNSFSDFMNVAFLVKMLLTF